MLEWALAHARAGWAVFPIWNALEGGTCACNPGGECRKGHIGKHPRTRHGHLEATTDEARIRAWWDPSAPETGAEPWTRSAESSIGIAIPDGIFVLDVDERSGGEASLRALFEQYGSGWADTMRIHSGNGAHLYFRAPPGLRFPDKIGAGLDIRQRGNYVLAPPSRHKSGGFYRLPDVQRPLLELPAWLAVQGTFRQAAVTRETLEGLLDNEPSTAPRVLAKRTAIVAILRPHVETKGIGHYLCLALGGLCRNADGNVTGAGWKPEDAAALVWDLLAGCRNDADRFAGVQTALKAYAMTGRPAGYSKLAELIGDETARVVADSAKDPYGTLRAARAALTANERSAAGEVIRKRYT